MRTSLISLLCISSILAFSLFNFSVFAGVTYNNNLESVVAKIPLSKMPEKQQREAIEKSLQALVGYLQDTIDPEKVSDNKMTIAAYDYLEEIKGKIDELIPKFQNIANNGYIPGVHTWGEIVPTAILVVFGAKADAGATVSGGGSISIGVVIQPFLYKKVDVKTQKTSTTWGIDVAFIGMPTGDIGFGAGGGGKGRIGIGFIWGDMNSPHDFTGFATGLSLSGEYIAGLNFKGGALFKKVNNKYKATMYFATLSWVAGASGSASAHVFGMPMFDLPRFFMRMLNINEDDIERSMQTKMNENTANTGSNR